MKNRDYVNAEGIENGIDFDAHYRVKGWPAVAFRLYGWRKEYEPVMCLCSDDEGNEWEEESGEFDEVADYQTVIAVMVGDDRKHHVDISDLVKIEEDAFCRDCGQIGCGCNVYV